MNQTTQPEQELPSVESLAIAAISGTVKLGSLPRGLRTKVLSILSEWRREEVEIQECNWFRRIAKRFARWRRRMKYGEHTDLFSLSELLNSYEFRVVGAIGIGVSSAVSTWPPADYPREEYYGSRDEYLSAAKEYWMARIHSSELAPSPYQTMCAVLDYIDFRLGNLQGRRALDFKSVLPRSLVAGVNGSSFAEAKVLKSEIKSAIRANGPAGHRRLLKELETIGAEVLKADFSLGSPIEGKFSAASRRPQPEPNADSEPVEIVIDYDPPVSDSLLP